MAKIYDKNYSNQDLIIPSLIWNDNTVNGVAKIILTLIKSFTNTGKKPCYALTGQMSKILHTHEKDIKYNMRKLHENGHIELFGDEQSPTGWSVNYTYSELDKAQPESSGSSQLF